MRRTLTALLLSTVAALGAVVVPSVAHASHAEGFISGNGWPGDDWADEGEIWSGDHRRSYATGIWQAVLYADGYLNWGDIDCDFGPKTTAATRKWQSSHGVGVDGRVGPQTFGRADDQLVMVDDRGDSATIAYIGTTYDLEFFYGVDGHYHFVDGSPFSPSWYHHSNVTC